MPAFRFFEKLPLVGSKAERGHSERPLRILLAASVLLPLSFYTVGAWISYNSHYAEARERIERTLDLVHEHAVKVFETFEISERYLEELFNGVSDEEIRAEEHDYSARLRSLTALLPQLRDLWVINADGRPLVSGNVYPMPDNLDVSDREFFTVHRHSSAETFVSEVLQARSAQAKFFAITRKRPDDNGRFNGVYLVSIAPEYFNDFYARLPHAQRGGVAALIRGDGAFLGRYPETTQPRIPPGRGLTPLLKDKPERGFTTTPSGLDGNMRLFAFRKLPKQDVYVVAGLDASVVREDWLRTMATHLIFGIPATLAMFGLAMMALRRTQRESLAYVQLREETERRESTERALRQAQKMEAVGRLTGGIAHDFNNLLTAILGNVDLVLRRIKPEEERLARSLNAVRQASQRAATLVQRLLTFSRQHPQEMKAVAINRLVEDMSELLHRTLDESVSIDTVLADGLWKCATDPNQLENAIINLAVNARDAMTGRGGHLTIETANVFLDEAYVAEAGGELKSGQYVMLAVSDTGPGMSREVRERAFEPFFTTKPAGVGSGLGLSMVYGFVKQSNGHIHIDSEPGEGTSVKLYFPRLLDETSVSAWSGADTDERETMPRGHNELIMLVEDDEHVRTFITDALREAGYRVESAPDGPTALKLLDQHNDIALLLTDVVLPAGMNGRQLADQVIAVRPGLPVLFATGYTRDAIIHHGRLDPDVELLIKPFTVEALTRKVHQMLGDKVPTA